MKMKIRGLVFTGFAAAVFASSALDAIGAQPAGTVVPPTQMTNDDKPVSYDGTLNEYKDDLKATVTSKYYTNETFQERIAAADKLSEKSGVVDEHAAFVGWHYGQNGEDTEWVKLEGQPQMQSSGSATVDAPYLDISHDATNHKHYVGLQEVALTYDEPGPDGQQGWEKIDAAGRNDAADNVQKRLTTAKAVYDFVKQEMAEGDFQPKVESIQNPTTTVQVGYYVPADNTDPSNPVPAEATWGTLAAEADTQNSVGYLAVSGVEGVYTMNIASGKIASGYMDVINAGGQGASRVAQGKLTTAKAVYELLDIEETSGISTISAASTNAEVPTSKNVFDFVTQQPGNAAMNPDCVQDGVHCALVTSYVPAVGNVGDEDYVPAKAVAEWTVMAPDDSL